VRRKLFEWGAPEEIYDEIEQNLYKNDFLNDERFCRAYVHDKLEYQHWGRLKIRAGLQALKLPESLIRMALSEIEEEKYISILHHVAAQKQAATQEQLLRFLLQRGFTYDEIKSTIK
jgi:regulatory protein